MDDLVTASVNVMTSAEAREITARRNRVADRLKQLIVQRLELEMPPEWISNEQPLFGRGLELDSLDALELSVAIEYDLDLDLDEGASAAFGSIDAIIDLIEERGIEVPDGPPRTGAGAWDVDGDLDEW